MAYVTLSSKAIGSTIKLKVMVLPKISSSSIRASRPASMTIAATVLGC
mgnify:CR=1 FL=1